MNPSEESIEIPVSESCGEDPNPMALLLGLENGEIFLMPYMHLIFCRFQPEQDGGELAIAFTTHTFILKGRRLDLLPSLQNFSLQGVSVVSGPDDGKNGIIESPLPEGVVITSITVIPRDEER
jgi:hypothetical protein